LHPERVPGVALVAGVSTVVAWVAHGGEGAAAMHACKRERETEERKKRSKRHCR
jgi:hypothetical protein